MEVFQTGQYHISDLDRMKELQPLEFAKKTILKRLNYLLGFIKKDKPDILPGFVVKLNTKFILLSKQIYKEAKVLIPEDVIEDFMHLKMYPDLLRNSMAYYLQLLNFDTTRNWTKDKIKVPNKNYILSFLLHRYYSVQALTEALERNQAVQLFKDYITAYVKSIAPKKPNYETLEEFREARIPKKGDPPNIGWVIAQGVIEDGKFPQRKDTCMWNDAIKELPDTELKYLAACYGDFQSYNNNNEHFILTMEHTIVAGDSYCSCILHDTRINDDLSHPPKEFFDQMWPLKD
ncbi:MAG: hypothetical protein GOP50_06855 [Candidatus Heimdallarchaeota archaeon]|nr:hypothetical protein [Candidatus Heimdallarchaeota archaeon]